MELEETNKILKLEVIPKLFQYFILDGELTIGSSSKCDIVLFDKNVPEKAALMREENGKVFIENLSSDYPLYINKKTIQIESIVYDNDIIQIGDDYLVFSIEKKTTPTLIDLTSKPLNDFFIEEIIEESSVTLRFSTNNPVLNDILDIIRKKLKKTSFSEIEKINLEASLSEAISNAQRHGNKYNNEKNIELWVYVGVNIFFLSVKDQGGGFDYTSSIVKSKNGEKRYKSGNHSKPGIMLIKKCVDEIAYNKYGNEVHITKYITKEGMKYKRKLDKIKSDIPPETILSHEKYFYMETSGKAGQLKKRSENLLPRKIEVEYISKMEYQKNSPVIVTIYEDVEVHKQTNVLNEHKYPFVDLVPVFPGCVCIPNKITLNIMKRETTGKFWITPISKTHPEDSHIEIWYQRQRLSFVNLKSSIVRLFWCKCFLFLAPLSYLFVNWIGVLTINDESPLFFVKMKHIISEIGFDLASGSIFIFFLILGGFFLFKNMRKKTYTLKDTIFIK